MRSFAAIVRFLWQGTRGHHLAPWRSPYVRWRIETYSGIKASEVGVREFWDFCWHERREFFRFLNWTARMRRYARGKPVRELQ